jgi:hypothetical protein
VPDEQRLQCLASPPEEACRAQADRRAQQLRLRQMREQQDDGSEKRMRVATDAEDGLQLARGDQ